MLNYENIVNYQEESEAHYNKKIKKVSERYLNYLNQEEIKTQNYAVSEIFTPQMDNIINALWICFVSKF